MSTTDSIEVSGANVQDAIKEALEQLGAAEDDVIIEVLATPRTGVLGIGTRQAKVRVTRRPPLEAQSGVAAPPPAPAAARTAPSPATRTPEPRPRREPVSEAAPAEEARAEQPAPRREERPREERPRDREKPRERESGRRRSRDRQSAEAPREPMIEPEEPFAAQAESEAEGADRHPANIEEQVREASTVLARILELMGEKGEVRRLKGDPEAIELEIKGDGSGLLIGRHGQTLDALEYLVNRIVARRIEEPLTIQIDTESYRARRRQQLHRMALSMGERAKREHAVVQLDPMPPKDRRIIHLALKDDPMVTTRSEGEGFLRSVEIVPAETRRERGGRDTRRERGRDRERSREREPESDQDREKSGNIGEQGGFKHGQKRLF
ncbi:MAG TPA: RNA-binding cell elongation regulator Jag/EloR [Candidatus Binataceae bacterium]|nr:RNA-binding cell elongation regulator Jag/EloR [Candidatus Binataceae bacterium]